MTSSNLKLLTDAEYKQFWREGYLLVKGVISSELLGEMKQTFNQWVEESRGHTEAYGRTINKHPRFDLEASHSHDKPALRRVNAPIEISSAYYEAMASSNLTNCVSDLLGPNVKFHHSKINSKNPGGETEIFGIEARSVSGTLHCTKAVLTL